MRSRFCVTALQIFKEKAAKPASKSPCIHLKIPHFLGHCSDDTVSRCPGILTTLPFASVSPFGSSRTEPTHGLWLDTALFLSITMVTTVSYYHLRYIRRLGSRAPLIAILFVLYPLLSHASRYFHPLQMVLEPG